jgi:hypothetical protein
MTLARKRTLDLVRAATNSEREFISSSQARAQGLKRFYNGKPCKRGHRAERFVSSGGCVDCDRGASADPPAVLQPAGLIREASAGPWTDTVLEVLADEMCDEQLLTSVGALSYPDADRLFRQLLVSKCALEWFTGAIRSIPG